MSDVLFVKFYNGWEQDGVSKDGLPLYREQLMIVLSKPPLLRLERPATADDIENYPDPYRLFEKVDKGRKTVEGYPLSMWPACSAADVETLAGREVYTVEQLAKLGGRFAKDDGMPAQIKELADRAKQLIDMQKSGAKFEIVITDMKGQIAALQEQVEEASKTIAAQKTLIDRLRITAVAV